MSTEEKESVTRKMTDEFFASATSEEKKDLMGSMMPAMSLMFGGEGGMPFMMMQMMTHAGDLKN